MPANSTASYFARSNQVREAERRSGTGLEQFVTIVEVVVVEGATSNRLVARPRLGCGSELGAGQRTGQGYSQGYVAIRVRCRAACARAKPIAMLTGVTISRLYGVKIRVRSSV